VTPSALPCPLRRAAIVGCGYVGLPLARELVLGGAEVTGTTTRSERLTEIAAVGARSMVATVADPAALRAALDGADTVYVTLAAGRGGDYRQVYVRGLAAVIAALDVGAVKQVIYTSATSVYGQDDGSWVDGLTPTEPSTDRGRLLLEAEAVLLDGLPPDVAGLVLRLAGLWGPGRDPARWAERWGPVIPGDGAGFLNLIHRDDAVTALLAGARRRVAGVLTLADGHPTRRRDLYPALAAQAGRPAPKFASVPDPPEAGTGKRVDNAAALSALGIRLRHPAGPLRQGPLEQGP